jgi:hypothetical protein
MRHISRASVLHNGLHGGFGNTSFQGLEGELRGINGSITADRNIRDILSNPDLSLPDIPEVVFESGKGDIHVATAILTHGQTDLASIGLPRFCSHEGKAGLIP